MKVSCIILAAGSGRRLGLKIPKAFVKLKGKPLFFYSLKALAPFASQMLIALPPGHLKRYKKLLRKYHAKVVEGGKRRQDSVYNCLKVIDPDMDIVIIHDSARPCAPVSLLKNCIKIAAKKGACILALPAGDTMKIVKNNTVGGTLDRSMTYHSQTPQVFKYDLIMRAYNYAKRKHISATDDSQLVEKLDKKVHVLNSTASNIKIATRSDLVIAKYLLDI